MPFVSNLQVYKWAVNRTRMTTSLTKKYHSNHIHQHLHPNTTGVITMCGHFIMHVVYKDARNILPDYYNRKNNSWKGEPCKLALKGTLHRGNH